MQRSQRGSYGFGMLILSGALAFGTTPLEVAAANQPSQAPVEFFGCTALKGTAQQFSCMLVPDDQLTLWVRGRDCKDIQVADSGQPLQAETKFIQGGCQLRLPRSSGLHQSTLTLVDCRTQQPLWSMALDRSKPKLLEWKRKVWDRASSSLEDILPDLQRKAAEHLDPEELIDVTYALGWVNFRLGNRIDAMRHISYAVEQAKTASYPSIALDASNKKIDILWPIGMHEEARTVLSGLWKFAIPGDERSAVLYAWETGILARSLEQLEMAATHLASVVQTAERLNDRLYLVLASPLLAELYANLDRRDLAEPLLAATESLLPGQTICRQSRLLTGAAWVGLEMLQSQKEGEERKILIGQYSLRDTFLRALDLRQRCTENSALANLYLGLLSLSIEERRLDEARDWLQKARATPDPSAATELELTEQAARLAFANGKPAESLQLFRDMEARSKKNELHFPRMYTCRANIGILEAQTALGQHVQIQHDAVRSCVKNSADGLPASTIRHILKRLSSVGIRSMD